MAKSKKENSFSANSLEDNDFLEMNLGRPETIKSPGDVNTPRGEDDESSSQVENVNNKDVEDTKATGNKGSEKRGKSNTVKRKAKAKETIEVEKHLSFQRLREALQTCEERKTFESKFGSVAIPSDTLEQLNTLKEYTGISQGRIVASLVEILMEDENAELQLYIAEQLEVFKKRYKM